MVYFDIEFFSPLKAIFEAQCPLPRPPQVAAGITGIADKSIAAQYGKLVLEIRAVAADPRSYAGAALNRLLQERRQRTSNWIPTRSIVQAQPRKDRQAPYVMRHSAGETNRDSTRPENDNLQE